MIKAYTLKRRKDTQEYHLFEGNMTDDGCSSGNNSICKKMHRDDSAGNKFQCKEESAARTECANIGRAVCGTCVSHLYETYD